MFLERFLSRSPSGAPASRARRTGGRAAALTLVALLLAACQADESLYGYGPKDQRPVSNQTRQLMSKLGLSSTAPVLMRIFKEESKFEVWKQDRSGRYVLLKSYDICKWSGRLGPKVKEGDRQAPEGFYAITPGLMNPKSDWYLAFNTGFPNAYDRANGRTGSALMVHGSCSSRGCYAMTDAQIQEIYALARDAFKGGQKAFQLEAFPFRLTAENMARHWNDPNMPFWKMLKEGYDTFELTRQEPKVDVCGRKYVFNASPATPLDTTAACPADLNQPAALVASLSARAKADEEKAALLFAELEKKRKDDEETRVQVALAAEEKAKREAAERLEAARNPGMFSSLFAKADADRAGEADVRVGPVVVPAGGAPVPAADPRGPQLHAVALAEPEPARDASIASTFSKLFSFSSDGPPAASAPAVEPNLPAPQPTVAAPGATVQGAAAPAGALPTPKPVAAAPGATNVPTPLACAPAGTPAAPGQAICPPVAEAPAAADGTILSRIGNWF